MTTLLGTTDADTLVGYDVTERLLGYGGHDRM